MRRRGRGASTRSVATTRPGTRREHDDAIAEHECLLDVVGDRARVARQRPRQPGLHLLARQCIERGERLVEAQQRASREQRAREGDALAHAARQPARARALEARQAEVGEQPAGLLATGLARHARDAQRERGVVECARPRQQEVVLRHQGGGRSMHRSRVRLDQPADELQQRRLATAAGPEDDHDLSRRRVQAHGVAVADVGRRGEQLDVWAAAKVLAWTPSVSSLQVAGIEWVC